MCVFRVERYRFNGFQQVVDGAKTYGAYGVLVKSGYKNYFKVNGHYLLQQVETTAALHLNIEKDKFDISS